MAAPVTVGVIDYEAGNLRSIARALQLAGADPVLIAQPAEPSRFDLLLLPGVGAFAAAMRRLAAAGLVEWIRARVASGTPLAGICLGMQLLYERSDEGGDVPGLGLLRGEVRRLPPGVKVPHMGWNQLQIHTPSPLVDGVPSGTEVYFVHSYVAVPADPREVVAVTSYGEAFAAIVQRGAVSGLQFHPEKSGRAGGQLLRNLVAWAGRPARRAAG